MLKLQLSIGLALLAASALAAEPASVVHECKFATGKIVVDGRADEQAWNDAPVIDQFVTGWTKGGPTPGRTKTKAKILWSEQGFYFFAEMEDHDLYADVEEHDGATWLNDVFELFFKPADDKLAYYEFEISARNTIFDMLAQSRGSGHLQRWLKDGEFHLQTKVVLRGTLNHYADRDEGWSVEGLIPWSDFARTGGKPAVGDAWRFALCRYDYSVEYENPELTCIALLTQPNFHRYEDYATVKFVQP